MKGVVPGLLVAMMVRVTLSDCSAPGRGTPRLAVGDKTWVCLVLATSLDWRSSDAVEYVRFPFELKMDDYSRMDVSNAWNLMNSSFVSMHVQSEQRVSYQKRWRDGRRTFPFLAVVVQVENGKVESVAWDDACYDDCKCTENSFDFDASRYRHAEKQCYYTDCDDGTSRLCRFSVFVSWSGTDKNGIPLLSQQLRFSRFDSDAVGVYLDELSKKSDPVSTYTALG